MNFGNSALVKGLLLVVAVAFLWTAGSFIIEALEVPESGQGEALPSFVLTYICNSLFLAYFIPSIFCRAFGNVVNVGTNTLPERTHLGDSQAPLLDLSSSSIEDGHVSEDIVHFGTLLPPGSAGASVPQPADSGTDRANETCAIQRAAITVAPVWFLAQMAFNEALARTSVTSNSVLYAPCTLFTFLLSAAILHEHVACSKLAAIVLTIGGTVAVALADGHKDKQHSQDHRGVTGDALTLISAVLSAWYSVLLRALVPAMGFDMKLFFAYMGLANMVIFGPLWVLLHMVGTFSFQRLAPGVLGMAVFRGVMDNVVADNLYSQAVLLVGPTIASLANSVQIPITMLAEPLLHRTGWWSNPTERAYELTGAAAILVGFVLVTFSKA